MVIKELKEKLNEMPDDAEVIVLDPTLIGYRIDDVKHFESTIHEEGLVKIYIG
jgi:hypothetical protein